MSDLALHNAHSPHRILVIDDDPGVLFLVRARLQGENFSLITASSAEQALTHVMANGLPDLAVVDIRLPGMGGLELARILRRMSEELPIILLSAVDDEDVVVNSLEQFAQDYVRKPFFPRELLARIRSQLASRDKLPTDQFVLDGDVVVNLATMEVRRGERTEILTPTEAKILRMLLEKPGNTLGPDDLLDQIWASGAVGRSALRVNIYRLRQKIEVDPNNPRILITQRGQGYTLQLPQGTRSL